MSRKAHLLLAGLLMVLGGACKRPETAVRERPVQRIELVQMVPGMTPDEEKALVAQLSQGLGIPGDTSEEGPGPVRIFRLTLKGGPNPNVGRGLGKTLLISTGSGALVGLLIPAFGFTTWATVRSAALATGAGGLLGLAYGPFWFKENQSLEQEMGYLPWYFIAEWDVLERRPRFGEEVVAHSGSPGIFFGRRTPHLDLRSTMKPLPPESRSEAEVRQASLKAYGEALVKHFRKKV